MDRLSTDTLSWAPARPVFLRRVFIGGAMTFAGMAAVGLVFAAYAGLPLGWVFIVAFVLALGFVIEDLVRWNAARFDRWTIEGGLLIHDGADGRAQIPLTEIADVRSQWGSRVVVTLRSGQRMLIRYLRFPDAAVQQMNVARGAV